MICNNPYLLGEAMTLREKTIYLLEKNRGAFISGQEIADAANVSRSAVAKCVSGLKSEGYPIRSVNNMGHCLESDCDILSEAGIHAYFDENAPEIRIFKSIDSTNSEAKRAIADGLVSDAIFVAEEQTAGRGRQGKSFYSPNGKGLYFTAVLHPNVSLADSTGLTAAAAVAVCEVISEATKKSPEIKWVNDIFIGTKKICGILTEAVSDLESGEVQAIVVGIGLNICIEEFPDELKDIAASLNARLNRCELSTKLFKRLKNFSDRLPERSFMQDYRRYSLVLGREITFFRNGIFYTAKAVGIHDDGALEVVTEDGEKLILNGGEISIRPKLMP